MRYGEKAIRSRRCGRPKTLAATTGPSTSTSLAIPPPSGVGTAAPRRPGRWPPGPSPPIDGWRADARWQQPRRSAGAARPRFCYSRVAALRFDDQRQQPSAQWHCRRDTFAADRDLAPGPAPELALQVVVQRAGGSGTSVTRPQEPDVDGVAVDGHQFDRAAVRFGQRADR